MKRLTIKERRYVDALLGSANGNQTQAAKDAGYSAKSARRMATRLSTKAHIRAAIEKRQIALAANGIAAAEERDQVLSTILRSTTEETRDRIKAVSELNKCTGRHSIKHEVTGRLKLEQILTNSMADV